MGVGKRQLLIGELLSHEACLGERCHIERLDDQIWQCIDEDEELDGPMLIVLAEEPAMAFCDYQGGSDQRRWLREQLSEQ